MCPAPAPKCAPPPGALRRIHEHAVHLRAGVNIHQFHARAQMTSAGSERVQAPLWRCTSWSDTGCGSSKRRNSCRTARQSSSRCLSCAVIYDVLRHSSVSCPVCRSGFSAPHSGVSSGRGPRPAGLPAVYTVLTPGMQASSRLRDAIPQPPIPHGVEHRNLRERRQFPFGGTPRAGVPSPAGAAKDARKQPGRGSVTHPSVPGAMFATHVS